MAGTREEEVIGWIRGMDLCNSLSQAKMRRRETQGNNATGSSSTTILR
jgi:hypothetical protein